MHIQTGNRDTERQTNKHIDIKSNKQADRYTDRHVTVKVIAKIIEL